ncbi:MAG: DNA polymerase I, partial [Duodenibacillus sp.]
MKLVFMDLETFSETPISCGSHKYAENCEILLWGYAIDADAPKVWDCTRTPDMPEDLKAAIEAIQRKEARCVWHNGMNFDTVVLAKKGIHLPVEQIIDTMVMAYQHGLPGALGDLCDVMRMPSDKAKDRDGRRLVQLFCKPLPSNWKLHRATRLTHPEDWRRFVKYCRRDVEAERALYHKLPKWNANNPLEHAIQCLDAVINRRGMLMDIPLAKAAVAMAEQNKAKLAEETRARTNGEVGAATQRDAMLRYIDKVYGITLESMTKAELEKRCADESLPEPMRELLRLRLMSTKTSIQKFKSVINCVCSDDRLRGCLQFRGAARTGRFSGRLFQPQNLARPTMKNAVIDLAIDTLKDGTFDLMFKHPSEVLPNLLRGEIIAPEGKKLVVADYSNVEGRVLAWLSGEDWKVEAFREFDTLLDVNGNWVTPEELQSGKHAVLAVDSKGECIHKGHDLYKLTYGRTFNVPPESVTKAQRQMGKVLELALGYGGGAGAFVTFARGYGIDLHDMAASVREAINPTIWAQAEDSYDFFVEKKLTAGLDREVFLACDAVKRAWRKANPS